MKVLIVIITDSQVRPECRAAAEAQTYPGTSVMVHVKPYEKLSNDTTKDLYLNCSRTRNEARELALKTDATHFLFLDSDIVLPLNAVEEFVKQCAPAKMLKQVYQNGIPVGPQEFVDRPQNRIIGGWYEIRNDSLGRWVAGRWVGENLFMSYRGVEKSLVPAHLVGCGCVFMPREAVEQVPFRDGTDLVCTCAWTKDERLLGECGAFGVDAMDKGFELWMNGDVVCRHLERKAEYAVSAEQ